MPRPSYFDLDPANVDADGLAEAQALATAGNVVLDGALCDAGTAGQFDIGDGYSSGIGGVQIVITPTTTESVTFTVTGKNQDGHDTTEAIAVTSAAAESATYWSQITQIAGDAATTTDFSIGTVDEVISRIFPLNWRGEDAATYVVSGISGTFSAFIDETFDDIQSVASADINWVAHTTASGGISANLATYGTKHARATRIRFASYTNGAELQFAVLQN